MNFHNKANKSSFLGCRNVVTDFSEIVRSDERDDKQVFKKYILSIGSALQILENNFKLKRSDTVPSHNKHTTNTHISNNKRTLFALTKMCLFWEKKDFGKINSLYFFNIEALKTHFLLLFKNCAGRKDPEFFVYRESHSLFCYWQYFLFCKFENQKSLSPNLQTKTPLEIHSLSQINFFRIS